MRSLPWTLLSLAASILSATASSTTRNPISTIATVQNATIHTFGHRITALSDFELSFIIQHELMVKFMLEPNHDVLADDAVVSYLAEDGTIRHSEAVNRLDHKVFKGSAWIQRVGQHDDWRRAGWSRLTVLQDGEEPVFEGAFTVYRDSHHIQLPASYARTRHPEDPEYHEDGAMVIWRDSDIIPDHQYYSGGLKRSAEAIAEEEGLCLSDQLDFNMQLDHPVYAAMRKRNFGSMDFTHLFKRQTDTTTSGNGAGVNLVDNIGQSAGCPNTRKVALVGVATDCTYTGAFSDSGAAKSNVISQLNQASAVWENAFNISLGLQNLTMSDANCPGSPASSTLWNQKCSDSVDISTRLNYFSAWRGTLVDNNSHWTLLSTCNTGSAVGLAWLGQACVQSAINLNGSATGSGSTGDGQIVSGANVVIRNGGALEWQIIAHETGHTYGAVHDCTSTACQNQTFVASQQCCPFSSSTCDAGGKYIMNPSTGSGIDHFSPCSIGNICSAIGRNSVKTSCLSNNKQVTLVAGQQCGNGIVEDGEDCDCGGTAGCGNNACCDPTTCKFKSGAVCDDSNEDCCRSCQFANNGTVCRASTGTCDPAETCSGSSPNCPADQTQPDGSSCGDGLQCASGHCTSRDMQCKTVMGTYTTESNDTSACDSSSCVISCRSPEFGPNVCYGLQQNFLDGTTCQGGGTCQNGRCTGASTSGEITSWINDHKGIVIGVAVGVGVLLLVALIGCLRSCCYRRSVRKVPAAPSPPGGGWQGWNAGRGQPMAQTYANPGHPSQGWFNRPQTEVAPPPPTYGHSVRYA